jgi:hypothetical protein
MATYQLNNEFTSGSGSIEINGSTFQGQLIEEGSTVNVIITPNGSFTNITSSLNGSFISGVGSFSFLMPSEASLLQVEVFTVLAQDYELFSDFIKGSGSILINSSSLNPITLSSGSTVNVSVILDPGWSNYLWRLNGNFISSLASFTFQMPSQTSILTLEAEGASAPVSNYQLKYFSEFLQNTGTTARCIRIEIFKDGYDGDSSLLEVESIFYSFGNFGADPLDVVIGSTVDFTIAGTVNQFDEFLIGGNRDWKVVLKDAGVIFWTGFINADFLDTLDKAGKQLQTFTATDGIKGFESIRCQRNIWPIIANNPASSALVGSLNQSYKEFRDVNIICNIHEKRMDRDQGLFEQFVTPDNSVFTDGEVVKFSNNGSVENNFLYVKETLERILNPFQCRVFLYEDEFWIVRTPDLNQSQSLGFTYKSDATLDGPLIVNNNLTIDCSINLPQRTARRVFTSFTSILKLGKLFVQTEGAVYEAKFAVDEWLPIGGDVYRLRYWGYSKSREISQPNRRPDGETALVQYQSDQAGDYLQIWTTTTNAGVNDPNLSFVFLTQDIAGRPLIIADELANKVSISFKFMLLSVPVAEPATNYGDHKVGFMVKIGDFYLYRVSELVFDFSTTENIILFDATNRDEFNIVKISGVVVPQTGKFEVRLYQLINTAGPRHLFCLAFDDFKLSIEQNSAFQLSEISSRAVTDSPHTYVHPDFETFIGDSETNMSSSAIRLIDYNDAVSELWTRDGIEELPLLDVVCIELANLKGIRNRRIIGTLERVKPRPYQSVLYQEKYWLVLAVNWDCFRDRWRVELFEL